MGEIAEAMINGLFCEQCGVLIDEDEPGYARLCHACDNDEKQGEDHANRNQKI